MSKTVGEVVQFYSGRVKLIKETISVIDLRLEEIRNEPVDRKDSVTSAKSRIEEMQRWREYFLKLRERELDNMHEALDHIP